MASQYPDLFSGLLNADPQLAYYSQVYGGGKKYTPAQQSYFGNNFGDIFSRYLGTQGQGLADASKKGWTLNQYLEQPQTQFTDYLAQNPLEDYWRNLTPGQRPGGGTARFAPPVRWIS